MNGADTDNTLWNRPEAAGLRAVAEGFRHLGFKDDYAINSAEWVVYDALHAYCREIVKRGKPTWEAERTLQRLPQRRPGRSEMPYGGPNGLQASLLGILQVVG